MPTLYVELIATVHELGLPVIAEVGGHDPIVIGKAPADRMPEPGVEPGGVQEEQGRVRGFSTENGCTMLGVAAPYATPMALMLDVTLSECHYPSFNKRYSGSLVLFQAASQAQLSLQSTHLGGVGNGGDYFDLKATMRR